MCKIHKVRICDIHVCITPSCLEDVKRMLEEAFFWIGLLLHLQHLVDTYHVQLVISDSNYHD